MTVLIPWYCSFSPQELISPDYQLDQQEIWLPDLEWEATRFGLKFYMTFIVGWVVSKLYKGNILDLDLLLWLEPFEKDDDYAPSTFPYNANNGFSLSYIL